MCYYLGCILFLLEYIKEELDIHNVIDLGTYSSDCLAVPLLLYLNVDRGTGADDAKTG